MIDLAKLAIDLQRKLDLHREVMKDNGLTKLNCRNCRYEYQNDEYTKGAIWAWSEVISDLRFKNYE
jgi:hypothetical protein